MSIIYRDRTVMVSRTDEDYDYIGFVENNGNEDITFTFTHGIEEISVPTGDWFGILANDMGYLQLEAIQSNSFEVREV